MTTNAGHAPRPSWSGGLSRSKLYVLLAVGLLGAPCSVSGFHIDIQWHPPGNLFIHGTQKRDEVYITTFNAGGTQWLRIRFRTPGGTVPSWARDEGRSGYARYEGVPRFAVTRIIFFGHGGDDVYSHPNDRVHDLPEAELYGGAGDDRLFGTRYTDYIDGGEGNDVLHGFDGSDVLLGGGGHDDLFGGHGNDFLCGGPGADSLNANNGDDLIYADAADGRKVDLGNGQNDQRVNRDCGAIPIRIYGDWDGDGTVDSGIFFADLAQFAIPGAPSADVAFGLPYDQPVVGDWNGDGRDQIGVFRADPGAHFFTRFYLDEKAPGWGPDTPNEFPGVQFGIFGDIPVIGDWNGDGIDDVGVRRQGLLYRDQGPRGYQALPWEWNGIP